MLLRTLGCAYLFKLVFVFFRCIPRSGSAGSYGSSSFSFLRNLHTVFHSGSASLRSHRQWRRVPPALHLRQHLLSVFFSRTAILMGMRCYLVVVLICTSLVISDVQPLFMCLLAICMSSLEKCLFSSSVHFLKETTDKTERQPTE